MYSLLSVMKTGVLEFWIIVSCFSLDYVQSRVGGGAASVTKSFTYKAVRYGGYYSTRYFSYSGVGYARYSRVYRGVHNYYTDYYQYMLSWLGSESFTVYKNTPSESISVCRNYEANENGTFLGVFTCPLPFEPPTHAFCCGYKNAQYCCKFWDVPNNVLAALICALMVLGIIGTLIFITVKLCINKAQIRAEKRNLISSQTDGTWTRQRNGRRSSPALTVIKNGAFNSASIISGRWRSSSRTSIWR